VIWCHFNWRPLHCTSADRFFLLPQISARNQRCQLSQRRTYNFRPPPPPRKFSRIFFLLFSPFIFGASALSPAPPKQAPTTNFFTALRQLRSIATHQSTKTLPEAITHPITTTTTTAAMPRQPKNKAVEAPKPVVPAPAPVVAAPPKAHPVIDVDNFVRVRDSVSEPSRQRQPVCIAPLPCSPATSFPPRFPNSCHATTVHPSLAAPKHAMPTAVASRSQQHPCLNTVTRRSANHNICKASQAHCTAPCIGCDRAHCHCRNATRLNGRRVHWNLNRSMATHIAMI
jgi:hypothetical protein